MANSVHDPVCGMDIDAAGTPAYWGLPQGAEINTPQPMDMAGECLS
jgi:hypothetical protein